MCALRKKYCVLGNCQANALAATLQISKSFKEQYEFSRTTPIHRIAKRDHVQFVNEVLPEIEFFMYQPISEGFRGGGFGFQEMLEATPEGATIISYPSIQFYGYHASARTANNLPDNTKKMTRDIFGISGSELFHFSQIVMAYLSNKTPKEAEGLFHDGFNQDANFIRRRTDLSLKQLKSSEDQFEIEACVHDLIKSEYQRKQVFWSPRHPHGYLLAKIAEQVAEKLNIEITQTELERMEKRDPLRIPQYPLQDVTRRALDLEFKGPTVFTSKTKSFDVLEMVAKYYELYDSMETMALIDFMNMSFKGLLSWEEMSAGLEI